MPPDRGRKNPQMSITETTSVSSNAHSKNLDSSHVSLSEAFVHKPQKVVGQLFLCFHRRIASNIIILCVCLSVCLYVGLGLFAYNSGTAAKIASRFLG